MTHFYQKLPIQPFLNYQIIGLADNCVYISDDVGQKNAATLKIEPCLRILKKNLFDACEATHLWVKKFDALGCWDCDEYNGSLAIYGMSPCKKYIFALATKIIHIEEAQELTSVELELFRIKLSDGSFKRYVYDGHLANEDFEFFQSNRCTICQYTELKVINHENLLLTKFRNPAFLVSLVFFRVFVDKNMRSFDMAKREVRVAPTIDDTRLSTNVLHLDQNMDHQKLLVHKYGHEFKLADQNLSRPQVLHRKMESKKLEPIFEVIKLFMNDGRILIVANEALTFNFYIYEMHIDSNENTYELHQTTSFSWKNHSYRSIPYLHDDLILQIANNGLEMVHLTVPRLSLLSFIRLQMEPEILSYLKTRRRDNKTLQELQKLLLRACSRNCTAEFDVIEDFFEDFIPVEFNPSEENIKDLLCINKELCLIPRYC